MQASSLPQSMADVGGLLLFLPFWSCCLCAVFAEMRANTNFYVIRKDDTGVFWRL